MRIPIRARLWSSSSSSSSSSCFYAPVVADKCREPMALLFCGTPAHIVTEMHGLVPETRSSTKTGIYALTYLQNRIQNARSKLTIFTMSFGSDPFNFKWLVDLK